MYQTPHFTKSNSCYACGAFCHTEWHHIVPRSEGGKNTRRNLIELCVPCHDTAEEFGWAWIADQYAKRHPFPAQRQRIKARPTVRLKPGEVLRFDPDSKTWRKWGRDYLGIYSEEVS